MPVTLERLERATAAYKSSHAHTSNFARTWQAGRSILRHQAPITLLARQDQAARTYYLDSRTFEHFAQDENWVAPSYIAEMIQNGPLQQMPLRILDVGCHHANLLKAMEDITGSKNNFNIQEYTGIDFSDSAIEQAQKKYPDHKFTLGDATNFKTYENINPHSKNLIVCCGVCDYLSPSKIKALIENLEKALSYNPNSRIYLTYRTTSPQYGLDTRVERRFPYSTTKLLREDGIKFYGLPDPSMKDLTLLCYNPSDIRKLVESHGLEIDNVNSISRPSVLKLLGSDYDYICVRRKPRSHTTFTQSFRYLTNTPVSVN